MAKKILITIGDPAGCGPFITLKTIEALSRKEIDFFVVGDRLVLEKIPVFQKVKTRFNLIDAGTAGIEKIKKGCFSRLGGLASLNYLNKALRVISNGEIKHLVTAPVSKEAVGLVFKKFSGHTEYLANYFKINNFAMLMWSERLKVVLLTRHVPLRKINSLIRKENILNTVSLVYSSLKKQFKIKNPRIAIASLNPHAGVNTFLDKEERIISRAVKGFGKPIYGPYPADTIFTEEGLSRYNCIICLYHDQAMIPFKLLSMREGVNVTIGLPVVRTSPAHGVAYDIVKKGGVPFHSSMLAAVKLALGLFP